MSQRQKAKVPGKLVWRIDAEHPTGGFVAVNARKEPEVPTTDIGECGWQESSLDLLSGLNVSEAEMDTLPGELIDEFERNRH